MELLGAIIVGLMQIMYYDSAIKLENTFYCIWLIPISKDHDVFVDDFICSLLNVYGSIFYLLYSVVDNVPYYISSGLTIVH